jgi:hypothetical protein
VATHPDGTFLLQGLKGAPNHLARRSHRVGQFLVGEPAGEAQATTADGMPITEDQECSPVWRLG